MPHTRRISWRHGLAGLLLLLLMAAPAYAAASDAATAFEEGNRLYEAGRYEDALTAYQRALATGYASGPLFYNMGNAYYRLDELGQAIRFYAKARRLMPEDPRLLHNLEIARTRTADTFSRLPTPFWMRWWEQLLSVTGTYGLFLAGLLLYLTAAALITYRLWTGTRNAWHRRTMALALLTGLLLLTLAFTASLDRTLHQEAVVIAEQVTLHEAPEEDAAGGTVVHEGLLLDVLRTRADWVEVRLPNGTTGWVTQQTLAEV